MGALEALEAAGLLVDTEYHVPQDHIWLVGTNHRTGSQMNNDLLRSIIHHSAADVSREAVALKTDALAGGLRRQHGLIIDAESGSGLPCLKEVKHGGICLVPHLRLDNVTDFQLLRRVALRRKAQLRLVNWVRDPLKVARSAYMYHIRGPADELWLHEPEQGRRRDGSILGGLRAEQLLVQEARRASPERHGVPVALSHFTPPP